MIKKHFDEVWNELHHKVRYEFLCFLDHPTERNSCYVTGYIGAFHQLGALNRDCYTYMLSLIGQVRESEQVRKDALEWTNARATNKYLAKGSV
jgi:hypothetical protein